MGFLYLAVVIDVWSRRVVGWAMGERMTADLVLAALSMALEQRKPKCVIHHSDLGSCRIPDDCIDPRRYPLLTAREVMRQLVDDLLGRSILVPGAFS